MHEKLPFKDTFLENCEVLTFKSFNYEKWMALAKRFNNIIEPHNFTSFSHEVKSLKHEFTLLQSRHNDSSNVLVFWDSLKDYPSIRKLALAILTLPYSTAAVERTFSMLRDIKDPRRNRLDSSAVESCLLAHQELGSIDQLFITNEMLENYENQWRIEDPIEIIPEINQQEPINDPQDNLGEILASKNEEEKESQDVKEEINCQGSEQEEESQISSKKRKSSNIQPDPFNDQEFDQKPKKQKKSLRKLSQKSVKIILSSQKSTDI